MSDTSDKLYENLTKPHTMVLFVLLMLGLYWFTIFQSSLFDRDETRFSSATLEMLASGDYIVPTFNGDLRPDKPILIYWLMSIGVTLLGPCEAGVRFFAPVGMAVSSLLTGWLGRRLFDPLAGFWSAAILCTSGLMLIVGGAATTDAVLLAFIMTAITPAIFMLQSGKASLGQLAAMLLGLTGAMLTKGPVGLAVPVLSMIGMLWFGNRELRKAGKKSLIWLIVLSLVATGVFLLWAIPANQATDGEFAKIGIGRHIINRILEPQESHGGNFFLSLPFYIPVIIGLFMPWTLLLYGSVRALYGRTLGNELSRAVLLGWFWPTFILMSVVATKLPHYILPVFPALAIVTAAAISELTRNPKGLSEKDWFWMEKGGTCYFPLMWFSTIALIGGPILFRVLNFEKTNLDLEDLIVSGTVAGIFQFVVSIYVLKAHKAQNYARCAKLMLGSTVAFWAIFAYGILPASEDMLKISPEVVQINNEKGDIHAPIYVTGYEEASLVFYINGIRMQDKDAYPGKLPKGMNVIASGEVAQWAQVNEPGYLVLRQRDWDEITEKAGDLPIKEIGHRWGINVPKGRLLKVLVMERGKMASSE
ncbi:MAG: ArnT family glycosyltransferase [Phycisphaeraceae bacterium JB051]